MYYINTMIDEFKTAFQYNRCSSRGICSINPTTSALTEVILLFLKHTSYYGMKLIECGGNDKKIKNFILNVISILSSGYELSEENFNIIKTSFLAGIPKILEDFKQTCSDKKILDTEKLLKMGDNINDYIKLGEKEFKSRINSMRKEKRSLYKILFILVKSLALNILTIEDYGKEAEGEFLSVLEVINLFNAEKNKSRKLESIILKIAKTDCELMEKIRNLQEEKYGMQRETEVSFSTDKNKAVLVVGSNLKELEKILESFKGTGIDIYTHDNMILAHTFPKFKEYKNLKGQYGQGMENCLLDFSTFPGPIVLTKNSLFNIENLYRGRLFTTDYAHSKGVINIDNYDFSPVIQSALESKGFKTGKKCKSDKIGFSLCEVKKTILSKIRENSEKIPIIVGFYGYSSGNENYFNSFYNHLSKNTYTVSLFCCNKEKSDICLNAMSDTCSIIRISKYLLEKVSKNIHIILPLTDLHTLSVIIYLSSFNNCVLYTNKWNQDVLSPNIIEYLSQAFNINIMSTPKKDLDKILNL